jgi:hypothetical protein
MLPLDASELYDLSEAARLLWVGPGRIRRWIRIGRVPAVRRRAVWHLPRAWVDAACGKEAVDEEAVRRYWLGRLAPAAREAGRPQKDRSHLEAEALLTPSEAARRVFADEARLVRLAADGTLPALRVDGETRYDLTLADLVADAPETQGAETRRAMVLDWTRYEYATDLDRGAAPPPTATTAAPKEATDVAPHAWRMPDDLKEDLADLPPLEAGSNIEETATEEGTEPSEEKPDGSRLIRADGFETVDED